MNASDRTTSNSDDDGDGDEQWRQRYGWPMMTAAPVGGGRRRVSYKPVKSIRKEME